MNISQKKTIHVNYYNYMYICGEVDVIQILSSVYIQMLVVDHILMNVFL